jgi:hypothetical protein
MENKSELNPQAQSSSPAPELSASVTNQDSRKRKVDELRAQKNAEFFKITEQASVVESESHLTIKQNMKFSTISSEYQAIKVTNSQLTESGRCSPIGAGSFSFKHGNVKNSLSEV